MVDLENAHDSVSMEKLWGVLEEYGISGKLLRATKALYTYMIKGSEAYVCAFSVVIRIQYYYGQG